MLAVKIIHMVAGLLTLLMFIGRGVLVWRSGSVAQNPRLERFFKIVPHIVYTVLLVAGLWMLFQLPGVYPYWLITKIVLFGVAVSASIKAFRVTASRQQQRGGIVLAALAYAGLLFMIIAKPGGVYMSHAATEVATAPASALAPTSSTR